MIFLTLNCDVLVVGAGPAGSSAAKASSQLGAKAIFIDKKAEIGVPVSSAEGIGKYLFPLLPFRMPREQLVWEVNGIYFWTEELEIERTGGIWSGYSINRKDFDKWLAKNAINAGAELWTNTELVDLEVGDGYRVKKAVIRCEGREREIEPKVVIAADGVDSACLKLLGFEIDKNEKCGEAFSYEMDGLKLDRPFYESIYLGDFSFGGYAYIFPKSKTTANVGVASISPDKKLEKCFEEFLELPSVKRQVKGANNVEEKGGWTPFYPLTDSWVYGNLMLAGDAATQNLKPLMEGFLPAIICGDIAGRAAFEYLTKNEPLETYIERVKKRFVFLFEESEKYMRVIGEIASLKTSAQPLLLMGLCSGILSLEDANMLKNESHNEIKTRLERLHRSGLRRFTDYLKEKIAIQYLKFLSR